MLTVSVSPGEHSYEVLIGSGLLAQTGNLARRYFPYSRRCVIVTDSNVGPLYGESVAAPLRDAGFSPEILTVPAGEGSKSFETLQDVLRGMLRAGLDRHSFLLALGGGVVGDLAGFAASVFYRGIPYVQIPTTIVSQVDSSVGGKTGINAPEGKNLIGSFHQPRLVLADTTTLLSLPDREYREGFAEIIKHAAIREPAMFADIAAAAQNPDRAALASLLARNVAIKAAIVSEDEFETKDIRALLNFGHTIGHAIESAAGYGELLHGEAISLGIRAAVWLSEETAGLAPERGREILDLLRAFRLPLTLPESLGTETVLEKMRRDKKFQQGAMRFVLLRAPGDAFVSREVTPEQAAAAVELLRSPV